MEGLSGGELLEAKARDFSLLARRDRQLALGLIGQARLKQTVSHEVV